MPYLIFPILCFCLNATFPARAFSVYLLLPVLNLLNLFFLLTFLVVFKIKEGAWEGLGMGCMLG